MLTSAALADNRFSRICDRSPKWASLSRLRTDAWASSSWLANHLTSRDRTALWVMPRRSQSLSRACLAARSNWSRMTARFAVIDLTLVPDAAPGGRSQDVALTTTTQFPLVGPQTNATA